MFYCNKDSALLDIFNSERKKYYLNNCVLDLLKKLKNGVAHLDDLIYLLYDSENFPMFGKDSPKPEANMVEMLTTIYANFARTGNPIPHKNKNRNLDDVIWESFTPKSQKYMDIGKRLIMKEKLYEKRFKLWENLFPLSMYRN